MSKESSNFIDEAILGREQPYTDIEIVKNISECDFVLLPHSWEHYYKNNEFKQLNSIIESTNDHSKKLIGVTNGDYGYTPLDKESILLRRGGFGSKRMINQFEVPRFFGDPIEDYYSGKLSFRKKKFPITIGFCGKINSRFINELYDTFQLIGVKCQYIFNKYAKEPLPIYPTANRLRTRVIKSCGNSGIKTNFIFRKKFMAGLLGKPKELIKSHKTTLEFYNNIRDSDYTLCMRGVGNYSIRFYQTLSMGRIPVFINTDCLLPFDKIIKWQEIIPWVEYKDIGKLPEILLEYHHKFSEESFIEQQQLMRSIWEKYLSHDGFFSSIGSYLKRNVTQ